MTDPAAAKRVYVYEVKLAKEDGTRGSGWSVVVVTDTMDPAALLRVAKVAAADQLSGGSEEWTGLDQATLMHTGHLDPGIAV